MCYGCSKRTGALMIGLLEFIYSLTILVLASIRLITVSNGHMIFVGKALLSVFDMWMCVLLCIGVIMQLSKPVICWLAYAAVHFPMVLISVPIIIFYYDDIREKLNVSQANFTITVIILFVANCVHCFLTCVVCYYYMDLVLGSMEKGNVEEGDVKKKKENVKKGNLEEEKATQEESSIAQPQRESSSQSKRNQIAPT